jgi:hypothetical protein
MYQQRQQKQHMQFGCESLALSKFAMFKRFYPCTRDSFITHSLEYLFQTYNLVFSFP